MAACLLDFFSFSSVFATLGAVQDEKENAEMVYNVNISWYSIDSIFSLLAAAMRVGIAGLGISLYVTAMNEVTEQDDPRFIINATGLGVFIFAELCYAYRIALSIMGIINFFVT